MLIDTIFRFTSRYPALHRAIKPLGGPVYRRLQALSFERERRRSGWSFPATIAPATGIAMARGTYETPTANLLRRLLRPGDTFIDIGANVGYFAVLAARRVGTEGRVLAVEPEPENFASLARNTRGMSQVVALSAACADRDGLLPLFLSSHAACHSLVATGTYQEGASRLTPAFSLDSMLASFGITGELVVKIDVEGAEPLVLRGMRRALEAGRVRQIILEFSPRLLSNAGFDPLGIWRELAPQFALVTVDSAHGGLPAGAPLHDIATFSALSEHLLAQPAVTHANLWGQNTV